MMVDVYGAFAAGDVERAFDILMHTCLWLNMSSSKASDWL